MRRFVDRKRQRFARDLRGRGLEIGALQNPMRLPHATEVMYSDILTPEQLDRVYPGSRHPDVISDSESFPTITDDSFDFVVANHVLEHVSSPIRALEEWHRLLRHDGLLMMAIPDKRFTFDSQRDRTSLAHLIADFHSELPAQELNKCHLFEWAEHVEHLVPGTCDFNRWTSEQLAHGYSVHNHVWVAQDLFELLTWMAQNTGASFVLEKWSNSSPLRGEILLLLRARKGVAVGRPLVARFLLARGIAAVQHPGLQLGVAVKRIVTELRASARSRWRPGRGGA